MSPIEVLKVRGRSVRRVEGLICLNDLQSAAGFTKTRRPNDWLALEITKRLVIKAYARITGKSGNWTKSEMSSVLYSKRGADGGTYAHPVLALAYAEFLNADLAFEVREVFLRYKAADATLADDILQRATPEENEWAAVRAMGRATRNEFTETLRAHGVVGKGYPIITNAAYQVLFGKPAASLKKERSLPANANLRDNMSKVELASVMLTEALASERITDEDAQGNDECRRATASSAGSIKQAVDEDRKTRRRRLAGL